MRHFPQTARLVRLIVTGVGMSLLTAASAAARPLAPDSDGAPALAPALAPAAVGSPLWQFILVALASAVVVLAAVALAPKVAAGRPRAAHATPSVARPRGA